jgi:hypothetical protein
LHLLIFLLSSAERSGTGFDFRETSAEINRPRSRSRPRPRLRLRSTHRAIEDEDEDEDESENKNAFISHKTENEGIQRTLPKTDRQAGLILLFAEKWGVG